MSRPRSTTRDGRDTVHLVARLGGDRTACGRVVTAGVFRGTVPGKVTCGRCRRTGDFRATRKGRAPERVRPLSVEELATLGRGQ